MDDSDADQEPEKKKIKRTTFLEENNILPSRRLSNRHRVSTSKEKCDDNVVNEEESEYFLKTVDISDRVGGEEYSGKYFKKILGLEWSNKFVCFKVQMMVKRQPKKK